MARTIKRRRLIYPSNTKTSEFLQTLADKGLARRSTTRMIADAFYIPKHNPAKPLGEDSHFVCAAAQTIGVADGVRGWAKKGIDAGEYARELMANAVLSVRHQIETVGSVDPTTVLDEAYLNTNLDGSSTACILTLVDSDRVRAVNAGDSGFAVIRGGKTVYRSPVQQTRFNCPVQLGNSRDDPCVAEQIEVKVKPGDVIIMGTDGLFDNVHEDELEDIVFEECFFKEADEKKPRALAMKIAQYALNNSENENIFTPFAVASRLAGIDEHAIGDKYDDITVVVAYIQET